MMNVVNSLLGLIIVGAGIVYMLYIRARRQDIIEKYKPDTPEYKMYMRHMGNWPLAGAAVLFVALLIGLIWEVANTDNSKSSPLFVIAFVLGICAFVGAVLFIQSKSSKQK